MKTSVSTLHPVFYQIKKDIENKEGHAMETQRDFELLCDNIKEVTHDSFHVDTLRRLWNKRHDAYETVRISTLNILSRYLGFSDWAAYSASIKQDSDTSEPTEGQKVLHSSDFCENAIITLAWLPNRVCKLRLITPETGEWEVVEVENSHTLLSGDIITATYIVEGEVLYIGKIIRNGAETGAARIGLDKGVRFI